MEQLNTGHQDCYICSRGSPLTKKSHCYWWGSIPSNMFWSQKQFPQESEVCEVDWKSSYEWLCCSNFMTLVIDSDHQIWFPRWTNSKHRIGMGPSSNGWTSPGMSKHTCESWHKWPINHWNVTFAIEIWTIISHWQSSHAPRQLSDCNKELEAVLRQQTKSAEDEAQAAKILS